MKGIPLTIILVEALFDAFGRGKAPNRFRIALWMTIQ
jgi:hypothetical protein